MKELTGQTMPILSYTTMLAAGTPRKESSMPNWMLTGMARMIPLQENQHR